MEAKTISKLLAASIFALSASASQAAPVMEWDIVVDMTWDLNAHTSVPGKPNDKHRTLFEMTVSDSEVVWGYNGFERDKKGNIVAGRVPVDYTAYHKTTYRDSNGKKYRYTNSWRTSALVIDGDTNGQTNQLFTDGAGTVTNTITFWNNTLDDESLAPGFVTVNMSIDLSPAGGSSEFSLDESFEMFYTRYRLVYDKDGTVKKVKHSGGYVIVPGDLEYTFLEGGYEYTLSLGLAGYTLTDECGDSGYASCYLVGEDLGAKLTKQDIGVMNFTATITAAAVPEPETYAMLLAGLGIVGMVSRRRRNMTRN